MKNEGKKPDLKVIKKDNDDIERTSQADQKISKEKIDECLNRLISIVNERGDVRKDELGQIIFPEGINYENVLIISKSYVLPSIIVSNSYKISKEMKDRAYELLSRDGFKEEEIGFILLYAEDDKVIEKALNSYILYFGSWQNAMKKIEKHHAKTLMMGAKSKKIRDLFFNLYPWGKADEHDLLVFIIDAKDKKIRERAVNMFKWESASKEALKAIEIHAMDEEIRKKAGEYL